MLKIKVNNKFNFELSSELNQIVINGLPFHGDILKMANHTKIGRKSVQSIGSISDLNEKVNHLIRYTLLFSK